MKFAVWAMEERLQFIEWLAATHPELLKHARNVDQALIKGHKMIINTAYGISSAERALMIGLLKEYYRLHTEQWHEKAE